MFHDKKERQIHKKTTYDVGTGEIVGCGDTVGSLVPNVPSRKVIQQ